MDTTSEATILPPRDVDVLGALEALLASRGGSLRVITDDGDGAVLPDELRTVLTTAVSQLRRGQAVTLAPLATRLTTQQAAEVLGVSRPTLIKMLEGGKIPYETPNRHRRIRLVDLLAYRETRRGERRDALGELARDAQELGLYDEPPEDHEAALKGARHKLA